MPYQEGDTSPPHINVHNEVVPQVQALANEMGVDVDLPPVRGLGDSGHVDDHNLIHTALDKIAAEGSAGASWAQVISAPDAVTSSYYDDKGGQWQYWEWNAAGTFEVEISGGLLWCLVVGGGGQGAQASTSYGDQGQAGLVREGLWEFGPGTHSVTVGKQGTLGSGGPTSEQPVEKQGQPSHIDDRLTGFSTQASVSWGSRLHGRGTLEQNDQRGYHSSITGEDSEYAPGYLGPEVPGRAGYNGSYSTDGCVIIATRIDVPTLPPAPPRLEVAPVVAKPVSISGPDVQEWLVRDKQGNRKVVYFLPGNTGTARSLGLTEEGAEALAARRDVLDAIATTDVPEDFTGDPVTLLPKKLRAELRGFVEVRATSQPEAVFSVTLGAGVLPGVMVGAGGNGGSSYSNGSWHTGGGGAGGVIGQGAHVPVILPVQGSATYTVKVASAGVSMQYAPRMAQATTLAVQGQTPFTAALGGGLGNSKVTSDRGGGSGASGGGGRGGEGPTSNVLGQHYFTGVPGQGNDGNYGTSSTNCGGGGGYGSGGQAGVFDGGAGFDLATALNLDPNDGLTGSFLDQVSVEGWIAGGGAANGGTATAGGGAYRGNAKNYTGGGGGGRGSGDEANGGTGGAGAVYIITDPT